MCFRQDLGLHTQRILLKRLSCSKIEHGLAIDFQPWDRKSMCFFIKFNQHNNVVRQTLCFLVADEETVIQSKSFLLTLSLKVAEPNLNLVSLASCQFYMENRWPLATSICTCWITFMPWFFLQVLLSSLCSLNLPQASLP